MYPSFRNDPRQNLLRWVCSCQKEAIKVTTRLCTENIELVSWRWNCFFWLSFHVYFDTHVQIHPLLIVSNSILNFSPDALLCRIQDIFAAESSWFISHFFWIQTFHSPLLPVNKEVTTLPWFIFSALVTCLLKLVSSVAWFQFVKTQLYLSIHAV